MLDKTKPYGLIYGDPVLRYDQSGKLYDWSEREVPRDTLTIKSAEDAKKSGTLHLRKVT